MRDKKHLDVEQLWETLVSYNLFTETELLLITDLNGYSVETLNNAIYARYGYRDYKQMLEEEEGE